MNRSLASFGIKMMVFLSLGVALWSLRFAAMPWNIWFGVGDEIRALGERLPLPLLSHAMFALTALATGPFQFVAGLRARRPSVHRWTGRVYVVACVFAGASALVLASSASGGPIAGTGFGILGTLWMTTTLAAWRAAVARNIDLHRALMRYSFAMTFSAVTLRLQIPIGFALGFHSYGEMSRVLAYSAWIPNVLAVWLWDMLRQKPVAATRATVGAN